MKIEDHTDGEHHQCIWVEEGDFYIEVVQDEVEITCDWGNGECRGTERMYIGRSKLIELLTKMDET